MKIDALAGTDERPKAARSSRKAGRRIDVLAVTNTLICGLSAAACMAVLAAGVWIGKLLADHSLVRYVLCYHSPESVSRHNVSGSSVSSVSSDSTIQGFF